MLYILAESRYNKGLLARPRQQQSYVDEREMMWESVMGSYVRDASSMRNKTQESILEPNLSLAHAFHELSFIFVCKNLMFYTPQETI